MALDKTPALFCTRCFASDTDGSWDHVVLDGAAESNYCTNCGGGNTSVKIPRWAVEDIRQNASWVGKRYYPHREDYEKAEELKLLRSKTLIFPGRSAEKLEDGKWRVTQVLPKGWGALNTSIYVDAYDEAEALRIAKTQLPYVELPDE